MNNLTSYSHLGCTEEKYIKLPKKLRETVVGDWIIAKYENIISVSGVIDTFQKTSHSAAIEFDGADHTRDGLYRGRFRINISTDGVSGGSLASITMSIKMNDENLWENIRKIPVLSEFSF